MFCSQAEFGNEWCPGRTIINLLQIHHHQQALRGDFSKLLNRIFLLLAAGKSQWFWEVCGLSCIQHVAGRACGLAGILLSWPRNVSEGSFEAERRFCITPRALVVPVVGWEAERSPCASSASQQLRGCMINNLTTC